MSVSSERYKSRDKERERERDARDISSVHVRSFVTIKSANCGLRTRIIRAVAPVNTSYEFAIVPISAHLGDTREDDDVKAGKPPRRLRLESV